MSKLQTKSFKIFEKVYKNEWENLRKSETIFENFNLPINIENEYQKIKNSSIYFEILNESTADKIKTIKKYFYENTIWPIIEDFEKKINEENIKLNLESELLLENTIEIIKKKAYTKQEIEVINKIEEAILDILYENESIIDAEIIEESEIEEAIKFDQIKNFLKNTKTYATKSALAFYDFLKLIGFLVIGVFYIFAYNTGAFALKLLKFLLGLFNLINKKENIDEIRKIIKKSIVPDSEFTKEFLNNYLKTDISKLYKKCWDKARFYQLTSSSHVSPFPQMFNFLSKFVNNWGFITSKLNPKTSFFAMLRTLEKAKAIKDIGIKFSQYRLCIAQNIVDYAVSVASAAFEIGEVSQKLMQRLKELKKQNFSTVTFKYDEFYDLKNLNDADKVFMYAISILQYYLSIFISIEDELKKNSNLRIKMKKVDPYLDEDIRKIKNIIRQGIGEIEERAQYINNKPKKYEENLRQNREKKLSGNSPTKPKKENLFDL